MSPKTHVAVLMGGWSAERDISLLSGRNCSQALRNAGYRVTDVDVGGDLPKVLEALAPDVAFNALHGVGGEDGVVQEMLEKLNIPYTHSGVEASALAMDKRRAKAVFKRHGLPVAADCVLEKTDYQDHPMPPPYVIKPVSEGSSFGITLINKGDAVPACLSLQGWAFEGAVMAEAYVPGREFTCAVMGDRPLEVMEIRPKAAFYDFEAKYTDGGSEHIVPAPIDAALRDTIREMSVTAHQALGCRGVTRTDFILDDCGAGLTVLELNTQPGMTNLSLVPEMAAHEGVSYEALVTWMVEDATCQR
ncbi:MAG: D-alanine--D-alanine ligase [Parvibaculales bacterium]